MIARVRNRVLAALGAFALGALAWAALYPVRYPTRDQLFEIPRGTWRRRMSGDPIEILPSRIRLALGVKDVLVLRNLDEVPQIFGPTLIMPGQSFRLPFAVVSENEFVCTAHASGSLTVIVDEEPKTPGSRLRWRLDRIADRIESSAAFQRAERLLHGSNS